MLKELDAAALRQWCSVALDRLRAARDEIDQLNVYPVPDGDTGTNLLLTMQAVDEALRAAPTDLAATVAAMVQGSLLGARGNSGVILSQLLRGFGEVVAPLRAVGPAALHEALTNSAKSAYAAVAAPVEGTLLTVAREAAEGAVGDDLAALVVAARAAAEASLARTPELLPALKAAGVVDAGGRGWCVVLEALEQVVTGVVAVAVPPLLVPRSGAATARRETGSAEFAYEVQYLLRETTDEAVAGLKSALSGLGDSVVVVGGDGLFNVHVHVNDVGAALEAGIEAGRPFRITVTRFQDQVDARTLTLVSDRELRQLRGTAQLSGRAVIAVASGEGLVRAFEGAGAVVVEGGPTANPSTNELLEAIRSSGAVEVVLLPNDTNVVEVARLVVPLAIDEGYLCRVVPTRSVVQGLTAVSVHDEKLAIDGAVQAMTAAGLGTRFAELTWAVRDCETPAGPCVVGDVIAVVSGQVHLVGRDLEAVARQLLGGYADQGAELVTLVLGKDAAAGLGDRLSGYLGERGVEVVVLEGGQPHYPLLVGVE